MLLEISQTSYLTEDIGNFSVYIATPKLRLQNVAFFWILCIVRILQSKWKLCNK